MVILQSVGVEHTDSFVGFTLCAHDYIGKSIRHPTRAVLDDVDRCDIAGPREQHI